MFATADARIDPWPNWDWQGTSKRQKDSVMRWVVFRRRVAEELPNCWATHEAAVELFIGKVEAQFADVSLLTKEAAAPAAPLAPAEIGDPILTHRELASRYKCDREAARKKLDRWRSSNCEGWIEATQPRPNEPRYLYRLSAVRHLFEKH
jgi:hypothetical protein